MKIQAYLVIFIFILAGCSTRSTVPSTNTGSRIGEAVTAPLEDLNLIRTKIPRVLNEARLDPYQQPDDMSCKAIESVVVELNEALGPDLDVRRSSSDRRLLEKGGDMAGDSAINALRDTTQGVIPFHGWVRKLTGAERHSREVSSAIAAGIVRRAFLKGLGVSQGCEAPAAPLPPAPAVERDAGGADEAKP